LSTSDSTVTPSFPPFVSVVNENEIKQQVLLQRLSSVREEFDLSVSDNLITPSVPTLLSVLYLINNETQFKGVTAEVE
jgi:hypothetical protein